VPSRHHTIRAICAELNTGNMSAAFAALESSVERAVSVTRHSPQLGDPADRRPSDCRMR
jgi:hypothetical protein